MSGKFRDSDIQDLKAAKPAISVESLESLDQALTAFEDSPHYDLLKGLKLSNFLQNSLDQSVTSLTVNFAELFEMGALQFCLIEQVDSGLIDRVVKLLNNLAENFVADQDLTAIDAAEFIPAELSAADIVEGANGSGEQFFALSDGATKAARERASRLSSVEAQRLLQGIFDWLRQSSFFDKVKSVRISKYWDQQGLRAPFIESMTFKQLSEMKPAHLLEKRSFSEAKVQGILKAIERCGREHGEIVSLGISEDFEFADAAEASSVAKQVVQPAEKQAPGQLEYEEELPYLAGWIRAYFKENIDGAGSQTEPLVRLMCLLPQSLTWQELAALAWEAAYPSIAAAEMLDIETSDRAGIISQAREKLREVFQTASPEMLSHWQAALAGAGISLDKLLEPYRLTSVSTDFQCLLARMLLKSLAADHPAAFSGFLEGYWTSNSALLRISLDNILQTLPCSDRQLREKTAALLPLIDFDSLSKLLSRRARFNVEKDEWELSPQIS